MASIAGCWDTDTTESEETSVTTTQQTTAESIPDAETTEIPTVTTTEDTTANTEADELPIVSEETEHPAVTTTEKQNTPENAGTTVKKEENKPTTMTEDKTEIITTKPEEAAPSDTDITEKTTAVSKEDKPLGTNKDGLIELPFIPIEDLQ